MSEVYPLLVFLHVLGAIVAVGPAFAFPLFGSMAAREPLHANFASRLNQLIEDRIVAPIVLLTGVTGVALIWYRGIPLLDSAYRWLLVSIVVYAAALVVSLFVQRPTLLRVIELSAGPQAPGPELAATVGRVGRNGKILTVLTLAIVFLMVVKPSFGF
jgi:uncharacterized membrane protein